MMRKFKTRRKKDKTQPNTNVQKKYNQHTHTKIENWTGKVYTHTLKGIHKTSSSELYGNFLSLSIEKNTHAHQQYVNAFG